MRYPGFYNTRGIYSTDTMTLLHYYVIKRGIGHRLANFLRLWTLICPDYVDPFVVAVFLNILEMAMCRALESLPNDVLEEYFGRRWGGYCNMGLNIVPPTLQNVSLGSNTRRQFSIGLESSRDPGICG
ncbi:hypothetical protein BDW59DRAFT_43980 [Aspergillus cavernicola]|uniref:Uncharacterized protein n=1 Tax=Aspergillus cavernicola TaxID=176166 RepID=A0ABR4IPN1_9EURO